MKKNITAYSAQEAKKIGKLQWYNDEHFVNEIIRMLEKYHAIKLFDICCGTGQLYPQILMYYEKIYALDLSNHMLAYNRKNNNSFQQDIEFICGDAVDYLRNNIMHIKSNDILLKNCLQFLDLSEVEELLQKIEFDHVFIVNTVNLCESNFFDFLNDYGFDFVLRTCNYITEEVLDTFCYKIGKIIETKLIKQKIPLAEWLLYHDSDKEKVSKFIDLLNQIERELIHKFGITKELGEFVLLRYEKIYCIGC